MWETLVPTMASGLVESVLFLLRSGWLNELLSGSLTSKSTSASMFGIDASAYWFESSSIGLI